MDSLLYDFEDGNGPVPAHIHANGGGIVADTAMVSEDSYVESTVRVYGNASVSQNVELFDNVRVFGTAEVKNNLVLFGDCRVSVTPKAILGFDHPVIITDEHVILGCHCFSKDDWEKEALAIIRVNGYPTKTARKIHDIVSNFMKIHFSIFDEEDIEDFMKNR